MLLPVIALIGRPNVGKSTLFNRLTRSRDALVADYPGLTRDRQYGIGRLGPRPYVVVDTGGISGGDGVEVLMERQVRLAIDEAQRLPELFPALRYVVASRKGAGRFVLTGSASPSAPRRRAARAVRSSSISCSATLASSMKCRLCAISRLVS